MILVVVWISRQRGTILGAYVWFFFICHQQTHIFEINHCLNQYHHFGVLNWEYFMILLVNVWQLCPFRQKLVRSGLKDAVVYSTTSSRFTLHSSRISNYYIFKILTDSYMMWFMWIAAKVTPVNKAYLFPSSDNHSALTYLAIKHSHEVDFKVQILAETDYSINALD